MKQFCIALLLLVLTSYCNAQISGVVVDENNTPIQFADAVLMAADSSYIDGTITDEHGKYSFTHSEAKFLSISCVGYETSFFDIASDKAKLSKIILKPSSVELAEIKVSAGLPKTQIKDGALVTNVENTILSKMTDLTRMLGRIPGVRSSTNGIEVFGKGTPVIYINNVKMDDNSELHSLVPANIKNIEVITSPGAEYDAEVMSVIKITTIRPIDNGLSLESFTQYSQCDFAELYSTLNINYRYNKLDIIGEAEFETGHQEETTDRYITVNNSENLWEHYITENTIWIDHGMDLLLGFNYQFDINNFIGAKYKYTFDPKEYNEDISHPKVHKNGSLYDQLTRFTHSDIDPDHQNTLNLYYNGRISGMTIDFNTDIIAKKSGTSTTIDETSTDYEDRGIISDDDVKVRMYASKLVLGHSLWQGKLKFGGEYVYSDYKDSYLSRAEQWIPSADSRNRQTSSSAFLQYSHSLTDNLKLTAGLRYEHVDLKYSEDDILDEETSRYYDNCFPSVNLSYSPGDVQMSLSYAEKTRRPSYSQMRNSFWYVNRFSIEGGNPKLRPYFVKDLSYIMAWNFLQMGLSYKLYDDYVIGWYYIDDDNPEVLVSSPINITDRMPAFNFNIAVSPEIGIWNPSLDLQLNKQWLKLESCGTKQKLNDMRLTGDLDNIIYFDSGLMLELDVCFFTKGHEMSLYYANNYCTFDFCVGYTFFDNLDVTLGVADIFDTDKETIRYISPYGYENYDDKFVTRSMYLQVNYRFNPAKSKYKGTGAGMEEKERF